MKNKIDGENVLFLDGVFKKLIKNKEEKQKENRFTYSDDSGLKVLSEKDILDSIDKDKKFIEKDGTQEISKKEKPNGKGGWNYEYEEGKIEKVQEDSKIKKAIESLLTLFRDKKIDEALLLKTIEKSRTGVYADTAYNRKLHRVGHKYGSKGQEEAPKGDKGKNNEQPTHKDLSSEELKDFAEQASESSLQTAIKQSPDPEVRKTAHEELDRRTKEEHVQEEPEKKEDVVDKKDNKNLTIKDKIKELSDKYKDLMTEAMNDDFSDKNKTKQLSNKSKELSRYIQRIKRFGPDDKLVGLLELKKLLGLKSEKEVKDFFGDGEIISISVIGKEVAILTEDCYCERKFNDDGKVDMLEFILSPDLDKGQGKGSEIFSNQVKSFKEKGFKKLLTTAAKSDVYNGYYTWARLGYDMSDDWHKNALKDVLEDSKIKDFKNIESLPELMSFQKGRDFWKKNGFKFEGEFDLSDNSQSMFILNKYMEEKKSAKK
jgi:hypothetical protein